MRVELAAVGKRYGALAALSAVDLGFAAGTRTALIGPNGSGKTTLIRVVMGLVAHDGALLLDGEPAARARARLAPHIAYVPQVAPQMAATVGELVRTIGALRATPAARIAELAAALGLAVAAVADRPFRLLSGGMKQKLLLALALAGRPRLVILDEPTASLDAEARQRFVALHESWLGDATLILCSHRSGELRAMVDRVVALEDGRVVHDGAAQAFVRAHTGTTIEVLVDGHHEWLVGRGFARSPGGWWTRTVDHDDKMRLVPEAVAALGPRLRDLVVRDQDRLAITREPS
jgi:ABC-type multidrug transport system ATPase subunit